MVDRREVGAAAPGAGVLLLLMVCSLALLALSSLLCCQILLQWGPQRKGAIDDLMIKMLTLEAPACCHLSHCSIESGDIQLLVKGTEWGDCVLHTYASTGHCNSGWQPSGNTGRGLRCVASSETAPGTCGERN